MSSMKTTFEDIQLPAVVRGFAAVANRLDSIGISLVDLNYDKLKAKAVEKAGSSDWNDPQFLTDLAKRNQFILDNPDCSILTKISLRSEMVRHMTSYLKLQAAKKKYPDLTAQPIKQPILIIGLPRTGTTLLQRLLSQDPASHGPALWELFNPVRIDQPDSELDRDKAANAFVSSLQSISRTFWGVHPMEAKEADECYFLMSVAVDSLTIDPSLKFFDWFMKRSALPDYQLHKQYLQAMHYHKPQRRWVLKSPLHMPKVDDLLATYPDANVIWCHRGLSHVIASWISYASLTYKIAMKRVDAHAIGNSWMKVWQTGVEVAERERSTRDPEQFFDMDYDQLVIDPIVMIKKIYKHFGMDLTTQAEMKMRDWLAKDKQKLKTGHRYSLSQFGFKESELERVFADYIKKYNISVD
mgnify:CR=1 FL=1